MDPFAQEPVPSNIGTLSSTIAPAVTGDLAAVQLLDRSGALGDGEFACLLAAANGHVEILRYLYLRGYDLTAMVAGLKPVAAANDRRHALRFLEDVETNSQKTEERLEGLGYPTVTVLLTNYNDARYLYTSLSGILGQRHPATEIIVVDDGSTDGSVGVIERYAKQHGNFRFLRNRSNRGQLASIQRALEAATSEYVVWASSDDLMLPLFLERSIGVLAKHPGAGLCFSRLAVFVDGSTATRVYDQAYGPAFDYGKEPSYLSPDHLKAILERHYLWMSGNTVVARRDALLRMGGFEADLRWHADWFAYYAVALRHGACVIPETLAMMRERTGTYSANGMYDRRAQRQVLTALLDLLKSEKYVDLQPVFKKYTSLFSPFGKNIAYAALSAPRHHDFALRMTQRYMRQLARRKAAAIMSTWQRALPVRRGLTSAE